MTGRVSIALLAAGAALRTLPAQTNACIAGINGPRTADQRLAERYAPIYLPMREELYLPILPIFPAFEGSDSSMADPADIAPVSGDGPPGMVHWNELNRRYLRAKVVSDIATSDTAFAPFAISYHVTHLPADNQRQLWRFLRDDEQAWKRTRWLREDSAGDGGRNPSLWSMDSVQREMRRFRQGFTVLQYFAYYLNDLGLEGHPSDLEPVVVFVPDSVPGSRVNAGNFRIVVGVGHTNHVPNGVAVLLGDRAADEDETNPAFRYRPRFLIEYGDHSSAPDLPPYGVFQPGWDVNWQIRFVWGTRDVQASHGRGFAGRYEPGMTFPRDTARTLRPDVLPLSAERKAKRPWPYALVPAELNRCLFQTLEELQRLDESRRKAGEPQRLTLAQLTPLATVLKRLLRDFRTWNVQPYVRAFDRASLGSDTALDRYAAAARAMVRWTWPLRTDDGREIENRKLRPWEHHLFTDPPAKAFKAHLFRPTTNGLAGPGFTDWAHAMIPHPTFGLMSDVRFRIGLGVVIPAIESPLSLPGVIEVNGGIYGTLFDGLVRRRGDSTARNWRFATWVTYEDDYGDQFTWFAQIFKIWGRKEIDPDAESSWQVEGGISFGLNPDPKTRLRIGPRLDLSKKVNLDWAVQFTWVR